MPIVDDAEDTLARILARWEELDLKSAARQRAWLQSHGVGLSDLQEMEARDRESVAIMVRATEPYLRYFLHDNSEKSAEELQELASNLSPGGTHTGGALV